MLTEVSLYKGFYFITNVSTHDAMDHIKSTVTTYTMRILTVWNDVMEVTVTISTAVILDILFPKE